MQHTASSGHPGMELSVAVQSANNISGSQPLANNMQNNVNSLVQYMSLS